MINEVYAAIYARLDDQLIYPVFDHVPENENGFPYVRLDPMELSENDTDTETGFTGTIQVISYSRYKGQKQVNEMSEAIYAALHRYNLPDTATYAFSTIHQSYANIILSDDGITRHSVQRFTIIFEPKTV
jgi:hypothetical protein